MNGLACVRFTFLGCVGIAVWLVAYSAFAEGEPEPTPAPVTEPPAVEVAPPVLAVPTVPAEAVLSPPVYPVTAAGFAAASISPYGGLLNQGYTRSAMARIDGHGRLTVQQPVMKPVTETRKVKQEARTPDGKKVMIESAVVQVRYVTEMQDTPVPFEFDVFKINGARLTKEEAAKAMKEEQAVLIVSDAAHMADVMSPLGRKLYRDDVVIIAARPAIAPAPPLPPPVAPGAPPFLPFAPEAPLVAPAGADDLFGAPVPAPAP